MKFHTRPLSSICQRYGGCNQPATLTLFADGCRVGDYCGQEHADEKAQAMEFYDDICARLSTSTESHT